MESMLASHSECVDRSASSRCLRGALVFAASVTVTRPGGDAGDDALSGIRLLESWISVFRA